MSNIAFSAPNSWSPGRDIWLLGALSLLGVVAVSGEPVRMPANVAVVYSPWTSGTDALQRTADAGATVVRLGRFRFVVLARPTSPRFAEQARRNGALMILDAGLVGGCPAPGGVTS